jgi:hypothetical protein
LSAVVDIKALSTPPRQAGFPWGTQNSWGSNIEPKPRYTFLEEGDIWGQCLEWRRGKVGEGGRIEIFCIDLDIFPSL